MHQIIIDGYNVIRQTVPYLALADRGDLDQARDALIGDVAALATKETKVTVVFDGYSNPTSLGEPQNQIGVTVIFSPHGRSADSVIEKLSHQARDRGDTVEVITSDATIQWTVMSGTVMRKSSREFAEEMREDFHEWQKDNRQHSMRSSLDDRLSPEALAALEKLNESGT
ncbi:MAG: NYN domain-containing protein [Coriobacteriia bacterium]|nr:NYN domain-containing protein [Coriobacteriia bacterium]